MQYYRLVLIQMGSAIDAVPRERRPFCTTSGKGSHDRVLVVGARELELLTANLRACKFFPNLLGPYGRVEKRWPRRHGKPARKWQHPQGGCLADGTEQVHLTNCHDHPHARPSAT